MRWNVCTVRYEKCWTHEEVALVRDVACGMIDDFAQQLGALGPLQRSARVVMSCFFDAQRSCVDTSVCSEVVHIHFW